MGIGILNPWPQWFNRLKDWLFPPPPRVKDKAEEGDARSAQEKKS